MSETKTMHESPTREEQTAAPHAVRNARELFEMLRAPHAPMRVTALKAIQAQPAAALSFGVSQGLDVIDVLISESKRAAGTVEWVQWLATVDCFDDTRVTDFFFDLLANEDEPIVLFAAARHLEHVNWATIPKGIEALPKPGSGSPGGELVAASMEPWRENPGIPSEAARFER